MRTSTRGKHCYLPSSNGILFPYSSVIPTHPAKPVSRQVGSPTWTTTVGRVLVRIRPSASSSFSYFSRLRYRMGCVLCSVAITVRTPAGVGWFMRSTLAICKLLAWLLLATALKAQFPIPTITSFNPTSISAGSDPFTLTVNGANFAVGNVFLIWTPPVGATLPPIAAQAGATSVFLQFLVPANAVASDGTATFLTRNQGTTPSDSTSQTFVIRPPSITSISPAARTAGGPGFTLIVNGADFVPSISAGASVLSTIVFGI